LSTNLDSIMAVLSKKNILKIHQNDNVIVALCNLPKGHIININNKKIRLLNHINSKHKFSVEDLKKGDSIYMYGIIVGCATKKILKGELISRLNISHNIGNYKLNSKKKYIKWRKPNFKEFSNVSFMGYERKNGSVGVENNWLIIPLVFCQNRNIEV